MSSLALDMWFIVAMASVIAYSVWSICDILDRGRLSWKHWPALVISALTVALLIVHIFVFVSGQYTD